tara:strand:+ start:152 stop:835 length:684 start_codon:yes stop_codon:yes gene_type:complete
MSIRRQAYEWRNVMPTGQQVSRTGHPVLVEGNIQTTDLPPGPIDIFCGNFGNTLEVPASLKAMQFIVIDHIACWPETSAVNIRINDTYYYQAPSGVTAVGLPGAAVPFPEPNDSQIYTMEIFQLGLVPPVYVLPGQTWGIEYDAHQVVALNASPTSDTDIARAYVKYLLLDGVDMLIAQKLLGNNLPVNESTISWYKRMIIRQRLLADVGDRKLTHEFDKIVPRRFI